MRIYNIQDKDNNFNLVADSYSITPQKCEEHGNLVLFKNVEFGNMSFHTHNEITITDIGEYNNNKK